MCKVSGMLTASFIKYLLLYINVVTPVAGLQEGSLIEAGPERPGKESYHNKGQQDTPAKSLGGQRKYKWKPIHFITKSTQTSLKKNNKHFGGHQFSLVRILSNNNLA